MIPVYKAVDCLDELYNRLNYNLKKITENFEIILVEDCGNDGSWEKILEISRSDPRLAGIKFSRNFGQHYGITAGLDYCSGEWVVVMDCDLQDRPEEIPRLYEKALEGYDVVLARRGDRCDPFIKRFTSVLFYKVFSYLSGMNYDWEAGNFRIISRSVVNNYKKLGEQLRFFGGLVSWLGYRTGSINVQHDRRYSGETSYTYRKLFYLAINTIVAYSDKPLILSVKVGFLISLISLCFGFWIVFSNIYYGSPVLGWSSIIVSLYFIGGLIIFTLGVFGLYLGKVFNETKRRPLYIIEKIAQDGN